MHLSRLRQQPFHSTLGTVNGLEFPLEAALAGVERAVPAHAWTGNVSVTLTKPNF